MATSGGGTGGSRTGIVVGITANVGETVSLERDTSSGFGTAVVIATQEGVLSDYCDLLPINGTTYYYRARVSQAGSVTSSYSSTVSAQPTTVTYEF